jgi:hypothetical protein
MPKLVPPNFLCTPINVLYYLTKRIGPSSEDIHQVFFLFSFLPVGNLFANPNDTVRHPTCPTVQPRGVVSSSINKELLRIFSQLAPPTLLPASAISV